jgi:hypothetical protein
MTFDWKCHSNVTHCGMELGLTMVGFLIWSIFGADLKPTSHLRTFCVSDVTDSPSGPFWKGVCYPVIQSAVLEACDQSINTRDFRVLAIPR